MPLLAGRALLLLWLLWAVVALWLGDVGPAGPWPWRALSLTIVAGLLGLAWHQQRLLAGVAGISLVVTLWYASIRPAADRPWVEDQSRLPRIELQGDQLTVHDLRTFRYRSPTQWHARWVDRTWDLTQLEGVDFGVARFSDLEAVAHTLVSFRFAHAEPLVVSVEVRKEQGETYGPFRGLFRQFELMYVLADERDALAVRAVNGDSPVFLHPMRATPAQARAFLLSLLRGAQQVAEQPSFYNTVTASCTTVLAGHLQEVFDLPLDHRIYLPGYSDALAFDLDLIDTQVDFEATRALNRINERAREASEADGFSEAIRQGRSGEAPPQR